MSYNYDAQLIDSVRLGQTRVEGALLFGGDRLKRRFQRRAGTFMVSFFLAALICAGCVIGGWVMKMIADMRSGSTTTIQQPVETDANALDELLPTAVWAQAQDTAVWVQPQNTAVWAQPQDAAVWVQPQNTAVWAQPQKESA